MVVVCVCACAWICCVCADVGECKEIKEERKMNLLVSGDGGHVGVWIRWWMQMHCICLSWRACQRTCWLADVLWMGLMRIEADGFADVLRMGLMQIEVDGFDADGLWMGMMRTRLRMGCGWV